MNYSKLAVLCCFNFYVCAQTAVDGAFCILFEYNILHKNV